MLTATNICKIYKTSRGEVTALAPCSLEFGESGLVLICGESGSGKTTLLNILSGADSATSGGVKSSYGKNYCSYVFQGGRLSDSLTVKENFALIDKLFPGRCADCASLTEEFGVKELLARKPSELSFGEVQRAAILRAAMANRPVLFADEPTANLDEENCRAVAKLLKDISRQRLVLVSTHEREYFEDIADRIIVLKRGKIVSDTANNERSEDRISAPPAIFSGGATSKLNTAAPRFGAKTAFWLAGKTLRRTALAVALTIVFLVVCLFSLITCSNIFLADDISGTVAALRNDGSPVYELKRDYVSYTEIYEKSYDAPWGRDYGESLDHFFNNGDYSPISDEQFEELGEKYGAVPFYEWSGSLFVSGADIPEIPIRRIYISDTCFFPVVYGSADLGEGIAISLTAAQKYCRSYGAESAEDMIGKQAGNYIVKCIYDSESAAYSGGKLDEELSEDFEGRIIVPEDIFWSEFAGRGQKFFKFYDSRFYSGIYQVYVKIYPSVLDDDYFAPITEGGPEEGEVFVSENYALENGGAEALLGTQVTFNVITPGGGYVPFSFTITGLFYSLQTDFDLIFSEEDADKMFTVGGDWRMDDNSGICLPEYSAGDIEELKAAGYSENSYLSGYIAEAQSWFDTIVGILAIVCAVSGVCALAALVFYAIYAFARCGREVGILRSFGLSPANCAAMFVCQLAVAVAAAFIAGLLIGLAAIPAWNAVSFAVAGAMPVYLAPLGIVAVIVATLAVFAMGVLFIYLGAAKKSAAKFLADG